MNVETKCLHAGYEPENGEPRQLPIYQSTTWKYASSDDMGKLFDLEASGYFYTRLQNPTNDQVAAKIAALEGGVAGMLTSSGQAANFFALFNICETGSHIVASSSIYGGTYNLLGVTMKKMGIDVTFVDQTLSEEELQKEFRPNTRAVFGETITNPTVSVLDIEKFARLAHKNGVPLMRRRRYCRQRQLRLDGARRQISRHDHSRRELSWSCLRRKVRQARLYHKGDLAAHARPRLYPVAHERVLPQQRS